MLFVLLLPDLLIIVHVGRKEPNPWLTLSPSAEQDRLQYTNVHAVDMYCIRWR